MARRAASPSAASGMAVGMLALAVCLVSLLSWAKNGSEASGVLAMVHAARPEQVVLDGHQHQIDRTAPTAFAEETDTKDEHPANAGLLTALLLWSFIGAIPWGPQVLSSALPVPRASPVVSCLFFSVICCLQKRSLSTLSGVFRL
jgi:hypothetical protein